MSIYSNKIAEWKAPKVDPSKISKITINDIKNMDAEDQLKVSKDIIDHILKARHEVEMRDIKANMIIVDQDLAISQHFYSTYNEYPPMVFGLEVQYVKNLTKDLGANFVISEGNTMSKRIKELEAENAELKNKLNKIRDMFEYY